MVAAQHNPRRRTRLKGEEHLIIEAHGVHQRPDGMKTVRTPFEHAEDEIHFRRGQNTQAGRIHSQITGRR